jgi:hypothetical protein
VARRGALRADVVAVERAERLHAERTVGDPAHGLRTAHDELRRLVTLPFGVRDRRDEPPEHVAEQPDADREERDRSHRPVADHVEGTARVGRRTAGADSRARGERSHDDVHTSLGRISGAAEHDQRRRRRPQPLFNVGMCLSRSRGARHGKARGSKRARGKAVTGWSGDWVER